eukprot:CAMPEP_0176007642 /NCGR_PEP_ID=MMETSP0120_2-20121206/3337_1 /TAXON_ID=160619 /ORGANISM="Kryptoperidinium foliaceum, Strain CCMP 1326" /LENGTH=777 /DNA_ID=CAMNT_0017340407 /DNA_START=303 /DNA_END=2636 /DNA_ORIENTATION=+
MVADTSSWSGARKLSLENFQKDDKTTKQRVRKKYKRKRIPETERERRRLRQEREAKYEQIRSNADGECPSIWSFESLFPKPVWDNESIDRDLFSYKRRDKTVERERSPTMKSKSKMKTSAIGGSSMMRVWRDPKLSSFVMPYMDVEAEDRPSLAQKLPQIESDISDEEAIEKLYEPSNTVADGSNSTAKTISEQIVAAVSNNSGKVDYELTRLVEDRIYGYRRGSNLYETSLMGDGAVKFRDGVRLGNPLPVNAARLNYFGKKELRKDRVEEAQEMFETAIEIDPRDGRAYLGLSRCAQRRRDFTLARKYLSLGIANSISFGPGNVPDAGANPFLLQALGCLEERAGNLAQAEALYIEAVKSRPSHAASWVALGQLRTVKFRQGASAGRACFQAAERELQKAGLPPNAHVYTAWASMEYKKAGDVRKSRNLYRLALSADKRCSAAWLQLGVMEANCEHWREAELCFETVLKFDQRNSRVLQAYALMESKRPGSESRKVIDLFERALKANPRDAGVLQPYALYVAQLGDIESARELLRRGTEVDKRHAPVWQAWGVLETREGNADEARRVFQEGIWACAQLTGGQSGGYTCARLWQAWGVLEAKEGDYAAARRCFNRALDADKRNMAAMTAWTLMEESIGNIDDARVIFERSLRQFEPGTTEKKRLWSAYESMEQRVGNDAAAQEVYRRAVRESISKAENEDISDELDIASMAKGAGNKNVDSQPNGAQSKEKREVEVVRWDQGASSMKAEVWMKKGGEIEGRVPKEIMEKLKSKNRS